MSGTLNIGNLPPLPDSYKWFSTDAQFGIEIHMEGHNFATSCVYVKAARMVEVYRANETASWVPLAENIDADEATALMYQYALLGVLE